MLKRIAQILVMALALVVLALPHAVKAQDASTLMRAQRNANNSNDPFNTNPNGSYGTNPYANQDGTGDSNAQNGQMPQDSTKKKREKRCGIYCNGNQRFLVF